VRAIDAGVVAGGADAGGAFVRAALRLRWTH
jgi:hypothetical protein